jgi:hypothetical protein
MPHISYPTESEVDEWHATYVAEVVRIFEKYKEMVPEYKHKSMKIV